MKIKIVRITSFLLIASISLQGCVATIISTPKQNVMINTNPSDASVYLNDKKVLNSPTKVRIKRKSGGEVKIEKEGYKTHNELLYPSDFNPLAYVSMLFFIYPYYVDVATGAIFKLNKKELNVDLIKIPNRIEGSQVVFCDQINIKVKAGEKLGNFYIKEKREEILYFDESIDVDAVNLKQNVNGVLKDLGFTLPETSGQLFSPAAQSKFLIKAEVLNIRYDVKSTSEYERLAKYETECEMDVKWQLLDLGSKVRFETTTKGLSVKYEKGGTAVFFDAFENALYSFMQNEELYSTVEKNTETIDESTGFSMIQIAKPTIKVDNEKIINNATNSIVTIENKDSHGSGCIISDDGYIVTNFHVVSGAEKVLVRLKGGIALEGTIVRSNQEFDLALVKINGSGYPAIPIIEEREVNTGSDIYAIGTPADKTLGQTVTKGIISGTRRISDRELIQTDVSINPGSSGGGLINRQGYLVGIVNAKLVGESVEGIGFAIPSYMIFDKLKIGY